MESDRNGTFMSFFPWPPQTCMLAYAPNNTPTYSLTPIHTYHIGARILKTMGFGSSLRTGSIEASP